MGSWPKVDCMERGEQGLKDGMIQKGCLETVSVLGSSDRLKRTRKKVMSVITDV